VPKPAASTTIAKLAQRLRELRQRHGLTQEEFADVADINYKHYQQIESGRKKQLWIEIVERLAAGYGLEAWELLSPNTPRETELAKKPRSSRIHNAKKD
jgi:transcriptional regulator with XRE-family HTH domain